MKNRWFLLAILLFQNFYIKDAPLSVPRKSWLGWISRYPLNPRFRMGLLSRHQVYLLMDLCLEGTEAVSTEGSWTPSTKAFSVIGPDHYNGFFIKKIKKKAFIYSKPVQTVIRKHLKNIEAGILSQWCLLGQIYNMVGLQPPVGFVHIFQYIKYSWELRRYLCFWDQVKEKHKWLISQNKNHIVITLEKIEHLVIWQVWEF